MESNASSQPFELTSQIEDAQKLFKESYDLPLEQQQKLILIEFIKRYQTYLTITLIPAIDIEATTSKAQLVKWFTNAENLIYSSPLLGELQRNVILGYLFFGLYCFSNQGLKWLSLAKDCGNLFAYYYFYQQMLDSQDPQNENAIKDNYIWLSSLGFPHAAYDLMKIWLADKEQCRTQEEHKIVDQLHVKIFNLKEKIPEIGKDLVHKTFNSYGGLSLKKFVSFYLEHFIPLPSDQKELQDFQFILEKQTYILAPENWKELDQILIDMQGISREKIPDKVFKYEVTSTSDITTLPEFLQQYKKGAQLQIELKDKSYNWFLIEKN